MKTRKILLILLIGLSMVLSLSAAVAEERLRPRDDAPADNDIDTDDRGFEEPLIAPSPETDETALEEYDNIVGDGLPDDTPHILDVSNGDYDPDEAFGVDDINTESDKSNEQNSLGIPAAITVGLAGLVIIGLLVVKRR